MSVQANGKVALVTGANSGIGKVTATKLALEGYHVFLACRGQDKTQIVIDDIAKQSGGTAKAEFLPLDLGDFASVRGCADAFLAKGLPLHLLINNAGLAGAGGLTQSGFETTFGVCHMGHFLLTNLLIDTLKQSAPARIVNVASQMHASAKDIDFDRLKQPTSSRFGLKEYGVAKLANILHARELAKRLQGTGVTTYALHPGAVATDVYRAVPGPIAWVMKKFMITEEQGAATTLMCATDAATGNETGLYYDDCKVHQGSSTSRNMALAENLWAQSEAWIAQAG